MALIAAPAWASLRLRVDDASQVGEARRLAKSIAAALGYDEVDAGRLALCATEAATNLIKHAGGGEILMRREGSGVELLALDRGPGIADPGSALADGVSSVGTAGTGLGAMRRIADEFDLSSQSGTGTAVRCLVRRRREVDPDRSRLGAVCVALAGESVCGDAWAATHAGSITRVLVVDGLGHGPAAAAAASTAIAAFTEAAPAAPAQAIGEINAALASTRGAAGAIAELDFASGRVRYCGIGNIAGVLLGEPRAQHLVSLNGILGQNHLRPREFEYRWPRGGCLVMSSDGLATRWRLEEYSGILARHPALLAGVLYRDHGRSRDDITVVALTETRR